MDALYRPYYVLSLCLRLARQSPDPNTKVGSLLVAEGGLILVGSCNRFPPGIDPTPARLADREAKNALIVHAEQGAIAEAAAGGVATRNSSLYTVCTDDSGLIWGGPPCASRCLPIVLAAGIVRIVTFPFKPGPSKWAEDIARSRALLAEAGVEYVELPVVDDRMGGEG
jgi:deoxycytidylate deaminase